MSDQVKRAHPDHPVHDLIADRWSPYGFSSRSVEAADLLSLFEAARWAPSSYNEQPWSYIVARKEEPEAFQRLLSCLLEGNQVWARHAPVLALAIASLRFTRNDRPNDAAIHDMGLAAAHLTFEATSRGICVHQMIGILPDRASDLYGIPEGHPAVTGLAIGYPGMPTELPEKLQERDLSKRTRKRLDTFVFHRRFGTPSTLFD